MNTHIELNQIDAFLQVYFYKLEIDLNHSKNDIVNIKFQSEEANTDEHIKRYLQPYSSNSNCSYPNSSFRYLILNALIDTSASSRSTCQ